MSSQMHGTLDKVAKVRPCQPLAPSAYPIHRSTHSTTRGVILADLRMHVIFSTSTCARTYGTFMCRCMLACRHGICMPISSGHREATHRAGLRSRPQGGWLRDPLGMGPLVTGGEGERCWFLRPIECHLLGPCCSPAPSLVRIRVRFSFCVRLY